jgi:PAS domain S-box-containing protein
MAANVKLKTTPAVGVWEWDLLPDRFVTSEGLHRLLGLERGRAPAGFDGLLEFVHAEDRAHARCAVDEAILGGDTFDFEVRGLRPGGEVRPLRMRGEAIRGEDGRALRLIGLCELLVAAPELPPGDPATLLERLLGEVPTAFAVTAGSDHVFTLANRALRTLFGGRSLSGLPLRQALPELGAQGVADVLDRVYATGEAHQGTATPLRLGDGAEGWYDLFFQPIRGEDGRVGGVLHAIRDVTDQVRARHEAEKAVRVREDLLYVVGHDLRSPLSIVSMAADAIRDTGGEAWGEELAMIKRAVTRMNRLIGELSDVARLEAGLLKLTPKACDPATLAADVVELYRPQAERRRLGLELSVATEVPPVRADRDRVVQVLSNLLDNALKFTERGGVRVEVDDAADAVRFTVADTGCGISADHLPYIFDRFWRPESNSRSGNGTGLGLTIAKGVVEAHGGHIHVESAPGRGTTFTFTLPTAS